MFEELINLAKTFRNIDDIILDIVRSKGIDINSNWLIVIGLDYKLNVSDKIAKHIQYDRHIKGMKDFEGNEIGGFLFLPDALKLTYDDEAMNYLYGMKVLLNNNLVTVN